MKDTILTVLCSTIIISSSQEAFGATFDVRCKGTLSAITAVNYSNNDSAYISKRPGLSFGVFNCIENRYRYIPSHFGVMATIKRVDFKDFDIRALYVAGARHNMDVGMYSKYSYYHKRGGNSAISGGIELHFYPWFTTPTGWSNGILLGVNSGIGGSYSHRLDDFVKIFEVSLFAGYKFGN